MNIMSYEAMVSALAGPRANGLTPVCFGTTRPSLARTGLNRIRFPGFSAGRAHGRAQEQIAKTIHLFNHLGA